MSIKKGEKNQPLYLWTGEQDEDGNITKVGFDLSGYVTLTLKFTKPSGESFTVTDLSVSAVTAPALVLTDQDGLPNTVAASTYFKYVSTGTDFDVAGSWRWQGKYTDADATLFTKEVEFPVLKAF